MMRLPLPGLKGTEPIGFLAAVGLLRVLTARVTFGGVKLGWSEDAAVLQADKACDEAGLIGDLLEHMHGRAECAAFRGHGPDGSPIGGAEWQDIKVDPSLFRDWLLAARPAAGHARREVGDFLSAFGSELVVARSTGDLKPTAFHSTAARQQFLQLCRELASSLDPAVSPGRRVKTAAAAFKEALYGPWEYTDEFSSMGLDPTREAVYALTATAPTKTGARSTRAACGSRLRQSPCSRSPRSAASSTPAVSAAAEPPRPSAGRCGTGRCHSTACGPRSGYTR